MRKYIDNAYNNKLIMLIMPAYIIGWFIFFLWLQEPRSPRRSSRHVDGRSEGLCRRCSSPFRLQPASRSQSWPDALLPASSWPHGPRQRRSVDGHQGVPVAVRMAQVELLHRRQRYVSLRTNDWNRSEAAAAQLVSEYRIDAQLTQPIHVF